MCDAVSNQQTEKNGVSSGKQLALPACWRSLRWSSHRYAQSGAPGSRGKRRCWWSEEWLWAMNKSWFCRCDECVEQRWELNRYGVQTSSIGYSEIFGEYTPLTTRSIHTCTRIKMHKDHLQISSFVVSYRASCWQHVSPLLHTVILQRPFSIELTTVIRSNMIYNSIVIIIINFGFSCPIVTKLLGETQSFTIFEFTKLGQLVTSIRFLPVPAKSLASGTGTEREHHQGWEQKEKSTRNFSELSVFIRFLNFFSPFSATVKKTTCTGQKLLAHPKPQLSSQEKNVTNVRADGATLEKGVNAKIQALRSRSQVVWLVKQQEV